MKAMLEDAKNTLEDLRANLEGKAQTLKLDEKRVVLSELEEQSNAPGLWDNSSSAQALMQKLAAAREAVLPFDNLNKKIADALELTELAQMEDDADLAKEIERDLLSIQADYKTLETATLFSGEYDNNNAIFSVNAGAGGTEAQDWAQMLVRAYIRWAQRKNFQLEVLEETLGDEAGLKGFQAIVRGPNAYGHVKSEAGVHRLVRISPFNSAGKRMTSFASIDVVPEISDDIKIDINPKDLRIDYFLSGGAGGQNVQKNETAVRITHLPTGLVAQCQNERSQGRNRDVAMKVLESRLFEIEWRKQQEEIASVRGDVKKNEWGSQIRSYVFQPYQMVKDHRTGHETGNIAEVMDGDFDGFMFAYLEQNAGN
ncbi:MAG TPA: peptide chain release factor 2 [Abditibacteriaceae bacterium]|jgi:peptide chain release factor 2